MLRCLLNREIGWDPPLLLSRAKEAHRTVCITASRDKEFLSEHEGPVNSLSLDPVERRYLLSGATDATVSVYDLEQQSEPAELEEEEEEEEYQPKTTRADWVKKTYSPLFTTKRRYEELLSPFSLEANEPHFLFSFWVASRQCHTYGVSCVQWYPHDTGMFFSGSFDHNLNMWDTNSIQVVYKFKLPSKVYAISLAPHATRHCLVAAGTGDPKLRLCDPTSGSSAHCLIGHRAPIWCVGWSPANEFIVASGSVDKTVRLWDIRKAGTSLLSLDQHNTTGQTNLSSHGHRNLQPSISSQVATAHDASVTSLCFTPDGLFLLTSGTDNRLRRWDSNTGKNTLVNYSGARNNSQRGNQFSISANGSRIYHPNGSHIAVFVAHTGEKVYSLSGHYESVNCCVFHPDNQELYSGASDHQILYWEPSPDEDEDEEGQEGHLAGENAGGDLGDTWSDDEG
ncbi:DNA excision repair protein ERCC-8 [Balamuthia mandrillaris]